MNAARRIIDSSRWLDASATIDELPCFSLFLDGGRIGDARLALSVWDANSLRTCYLGSIETAHGTLSVLCELPPQSEDAVRAVRDSESALRALDAVRYDFDNGTIALLDAVTGFWTVWHCDEAKGAGLDRDAALKLAHEQVRA